MPLHLVAVMKTHVYVTDISTLMVCLTLRSDGVVCVNGPLLWYLQ